MTDRDGDAARFDPRFDPAFQPGYDPRNDPTIAARTTPQFAVPPTSDFGLAHPEHAETAAAHRAMPAVSLGNTEGGDFGRRHDRIDLDRDPAERSAADTQDDGHDLADDDGAITDDAAPSHGVNPFLLALWALSALFIVGGIALLRAIPGLEQDLATGSSAGGGVSFYIIFSLASAAPVLMGLGLATATGTLFLHAARWRR